MSSAEWNIRGVNVEASTKGNIGINYTFLGIEDAEMLITAIKRAIAFLKENKDLEPARPNRHREPEPVEEMAAEPYQNRAE